MFAAISMSDINSIWFGIVIDPDFDAENDNEPTSEHLDHLHQVGRSALIPAF